MPLWNSRFRKPLAESALRFSSSIDLDGRLFADDIEGSIAHVRMLAKQKIISAQEGKTLIAALKNIERELRDGKLELDWQKEDIHTLIEERLVARVGNKGKRLHAGRSRNDQIALDERLYLRRVIRSVITAIRRLQLALLAQAEKHRDTVVPGYTHLQRAQPILFAHHLLAYINMLERDKGRFTDCYKRVNSSPLGAAALAGSSLPLDRKYTARILGFDSIAMNSIDAVSARDHLIEFTGACAITMMHLSRLMEEIVIWCSQEFSFATIDDSFATGSSLMPQKKNPDMAELVRGKSGRVYGSLIGLLTIMKALPLAYNRDMQEDKVHLFSAADTTLDSLNISADMLKNIRFDSTRFEAELTGDLSLATDIADYLVKKGMPFREAHGAAGKVVALSVKRNCKLHELELLVLQNVCPLIKKDIFKVFSPRYSIGIKKTAGSSSPVEVAKELSFWKRRLKRRSQV